MAPVAMTAAVTQVAAIAAGGTTEAAAASRRAGIAAAFAAHPAAFFAFVEIVERAPRLVVERRAAAQGEQREGRETAEQGAPAEAAFLVTAHGTAIVTHAK
jgi:hypothetical protein